jgi:hypothetical protein
MSQWSLEDLADYAQGVASPERSAAIEADLARDGDPATTALRRDLALVSEVAAVLREELAIERGQAPGPSAESLAAVSAMFAAARSDGNAGLPLLPLLAVHDPHAGLASGFRSAQLGHKDLEIHAEIFDLDLSVDTPYDAIDVIVVGRLTRAESQSWSVDQVPAILVGGGQVLATTVTNRFGEFHLATETEEDDVELCLLISGVGQIRVPIDRSDPLFAEDR